MSRILFWSLVIMPRFAAGTAKHVRQEQHTRIAPNTLDGLRDVFPRVDDIVVPADGNGREVRQIADDHLRRVDQFGGELSVRDDNDADHGWILMQDKAI